MRWERYVRCGLFSWLLLLVVAIPCVAAVAGSNALFDAIKKEDVASVRDALQAHPDWVNSKDARGRTAVLAALLVISNDGFLQRDRNPVLQAILERSPKLNFFDACGTGNLKEVERFVHDDPSLATSWHELGWSALHLAAFSGDVPTARFLIDKGAAVEWRAKTKFRNTVLQAALLPGNYDMTKFLIERGADVLVRQAQGVAPIHEAAVLGRQDLAELLLAHGAEVNSRADDGRTAVSEALRRGYPDLAEYLRAHGGVGAEITVDLTKSPD